MNDEAMDLDDDVEELEPEIEIAEEVDAEDEIEENDPIESEEETEEAEDEEGFYVSLGDEEPETEPEENSSFRAVRNAKREADKRIKELETKLKEFEKPEKRLELPTKPKLDDDDIDFDDEKFEAAIVAWNDKKREIEKQQAVEESKQREWQEAQQQKRAAYEKGRAKIRNHDYEDVELLVASKLSEVQQGLVLESSDNAVRDIYLLGKLPEELERLAKINDPLRFAFELGKFQHSTEGKTMGKNIPKPEKRVKGAAPRSSGRDAKIKQLEDEALKTDDRTKLIKYKRSLK